ncbi:MAG: hypothetical protein PWQ84_308 [Thermotogaceae bacterium]|jgi:predicted dehydrogenase|nr:hypothetical protein [Thermotogaceae bacterium]
MKKYKLGIAGCGIAARELHLPALKQLKDHFEITALHNRTKEKAEALSKEIEGNQMIYDTYEQMLEDGQIDAIDLALPTAVNKEFIFKAIENKIPVICEKPISTDVETAMEILDYVNKNNGLLYIAENFRHIKVFQKIKSIVLEGVIGDPVSFIWNEFAGLSNENQYVNTTWRRHPEHIGGFLSDGGVHHIAGMKEIFGPIKDAKGKTKQITDYLGSDDNLYAILEFMNGIIGVYNASYSTAWGPSQHQIIGSKGTILWDQDKIYVITSSKKEIIKREKEEDYKLEFEDFHKSLTEGVIRKKGSPEEALNDLQIIETIIKK